MVQGEADADSNLFNLILEVVGILILTISLHVDH